METFSNLLNCEFVISNQIESNHPFYVNLYRLLTMGTYTESSFASVSQLQIEHTEIDRLLTLLKDFLSLKNNRLGVHTHTIELYCKKSGINNCQFRINITRKNQQSIYLISVKSKHNDNCTREQRLLQALMLKKISDVVVNRQQNFDVVWSSLITTFPELLNSRQLAYRRFWSLTASLPRDHQITLSSLNQFSKNYTENVNGFFCLESKVETNRYYSIFTTTDLLSSLSIYERICVDGTYKLSWGNFVVIVFGCLTGIGKFRLIAFSLVNTENIQTYDYLFTGIKNYCLNNSISYNPKAIISDGATCIKSSIHNSFNNIKHLGCWAHVQGWEV